MTNKYQELYEALQPKPPLYTPETPSMRQNVFLKTNALEALYGGRAGVGKSSALLMGALQYVDVPGYTALLFRRTFADLALPGALMDRFVEWIKDHDEVRWNGNTFQATFPSGARIAFGYLNNVNDYLRYKGVESQFIGMDEVTEIREKDYRYLFSRMRKPPSGPLSEVPIRMRSASNPAPNWVRQRFIVEGREKGRIYVPATLADNPGVNFEEYARSLAQLDPVERARLEAGDWWAIEAGSMFKREDFEIVEPAKLPHLTNPRLVRFWDMAGTEESEANPDPDWTVGLLLLQNQGVHYVLDVRRVRLEGQDLEKYIKDTAWEDGPQVAVRMEQEPGSAGKNLGDYYARSVLTGYDFDYGRVTGDKETKAKPASSAVRNGNLKLVEGPWITDFLDEVVSFPEGLGHDDQVDALAGAFNDINGLGKKMKRKIRIIV